jgi:hypothetical protein
MAGALLPMTIWPQFEHCQIISWSRGEHQSALDVGEQLAIPRLVLLLDLRHAVKQTGDLGEALLAGGLGEAGIHVGPLVVLAVGGVVQVGDGAGHAVVVQELEPDFRVLFFVARGLGEDVADLDVAVLIGLDA